MKTFKNTLGVAFVVACFATVLLTSNASAQILRVTDVTVDTTYSSDSSWYDGNGILQQRTSRDCRISFVPQGEGMAQMFIALSVDSAKTWSPQPNPLTVLNNALSSTFITGTKATITVRVLGADRAGVSFKMTARQAVPAIAGSPKVKMLGGTAALTAGQSVGAVLNLSRLNISSGNSFSTLSKVYWDAFGDGAIDDSTSGTNALTWTWVTQVPAGASGTRRAVIARAIDKNGLSSAPETLVVQFGLQRAIVMKNIPAGIFTMGSDSSADWGAQPKHQVTLSAFRLQETDVTQEQYLAVTGTNPSYFRTGSDAPQRPVENVSWYNAARFCNALSALSGLTLVYDTTTWAADTSKKGYRLPTEAQWEYACRAGSTTAYWWGADTIGIGTRAWYSVNSGNSTQSVATKTANAYGLYDMAGNVWQWVNDWYGSYTGTAQTNPTGPSSGSIRVFRGGSCNSGASYLRSASRLNFHPDGAYDLIGFRVALPAQ